MPRRWVSTQMTRRAPVSGGPGTTGPEEQRGASTMVELLLATPCGLYWIAWYRAPHTYGLIVAVQVPLGLTLVVATTLPLLLYTLTMSPPTPLPVTPPLFVMCLITGAGVGETIVKVDLAAPLVLPATSVAVAVIVW